jgi:hypothetical protein
MKLVSVRVGTPTRIGDDPPWTTAFFKAAVEGFVWLGSTNLEEIARPI